jgi:ABC-2 type transport system ATP-binding protein
MADEHSTFWSKVAQQYDQVVDLQIGPRTRSMVRERVAQEGRLGNVVEFGCGTGFYTEALAQKAHSVVATDLSPGMLALAKDRIKAANVTFQVADCQRTSLPDATFDTAFISLVIHFTEPDKALAEVHRILKPGGTLIIANLDPGALSGLDRLRCLIRILYHGLTGYRAKPPKGFGKNVMTERQLCDLLSQSGFEVVSTETARDTSRSSNIPVEYIRAIRALTSTSCGTGHLRQ